MKRTLVAGIGNVFLGDDGFGVEVATRLARESWPDGVRVVEAGIRARHLAYDMLDGRYHTAILVDAVQRGDVPGTVSLIEPILHEEAAAASALFADGHTATPGTVLAFLRSLGALPPRVLIVGCEPASVDEGVGLSAPVAAAVDTAVGLVRELVHASEA